MVNLYGLSGLASCTTVVMTLVKLNQDYECEYENDVQAPPKRQDFIAECKR